MFAHGFETWPGGWSFVGAPTWGQTSYRASAGTYSAYCAGSSIAAPGPYADNMEAWMVAGPFDLSGYVAATLSCDMWIKTESNVDWLYAGVSTDGSYFDLMGSSGDSGGWEYGHTFDLADFWDDGGTVNVVGEPEVWIAFYFDSDSSIVDEGAYIDEVTITGTERNLDAYEPDDSHADANPITVNGAAQQHTIDIGGDEDWVSFPVTSGWSYTVWTAAGTPVAAMDTYLEIYDSDGTTELYYDDDGGEEYYSEIYFTATANKTVYARVTGYDSDETGAYALQVTSEAPQPNAAPVANANSYSTDEDTKLTVAAPGVLGNDTDADSDPLTAQKLTDPAHGSLSLSANGGFTYTPASGYVGSDSFTYRASDGEDYSNTANVTITVNEVVEPLPPVLKVEGADRYATAIEASKLAYPMGAKTVVIATGLNWPDALGGSALAGVLDAPILLVQTELVPDAVMNEIRRLGATSAVILGGTGAVGVGAQNALVNALGAANVSRVAGSDRYGTAEAIARKVMAIQGNDYDGTAFVATGGNFPDALAAAPLAAKHGWPLFLAHPTTGLSSWTQAAMAGASKVLILGGTGVVSTGTESYLKGRFGDGNVTRLAGLNRYETAVKVATHAVGKAGHTWNRAGVATGLNYPDALAGGVLQGKANSIMLLTPTTYLCNETGSCLYTNRSAIDTVTFFGGVGAVNQATRDTVLKALAGTWTPTMPSQPVTGIVDGVWHGYMQGTSNEVVTLNVKGGKITTEGSTLANGASMVVVYPYSNVTITMYVQSDVAIVDNKFSYTTGSVSTLGGRKTVSGTFTSNTSVTGTASHEENSFMGFQGSLSYEWSATR